MKQHSIKLLFGLVTLLAAGPCLAQQEWPKSIITANGTIINIYQPQVESFTGNTLKSRSVIAVLADGNEDADPAFGVAWTTATVEINREKRVLTIRSVDIDNLKIPGDSSRDDNAYISMELKIYIPRVLTPLPLDELLASLDGEQMEEKMDRDTIVGAPDIIYRTRRSMLVLIDGAPVLQRNQRWGLDAVVNSPFVILRGSDGKFYLYGDGHWYVAPAATGPYVFTRDKVKHKLRKIARQLKSAAEEDGDLSREDAGSLPVYNIIVSTVPSMLIQSDGNPDLVPIARTSLLYVFNSDNDILVDTGTQQYYVLLSGRWYRSAALNENAQWREVAADQLPPDFEKIPTGSLKAGVRASVAGTAEAKDAAVDAQVPEMVKVDRMTVAARVQYDGAPKFSPIAGTHMQYAVNTCSIVLTYNGRYYAMDNGIWFVGGSPLGPWFVSSSRPEEMDLVPPAHPVYPAKFISVYEGTPEYVYEGYLPGYLDALSSGCGVASDGLNDWDNEAGGVGGGIDLDFVFGWGGWYGRHSPDWANWRWGGAGGKSDKFKGGWRGERRQRIDGRWVAVNSQGVNLRRGVTALRGVTARNAVTQQRQSGSRGQTGNFGFVRSVSYGGSRTGGGAGGGGSSSGSHVSSSSGAGAGSSSAGGGHVSSGSTGGSSSGGGSTHH